MATNRWLGGALAVAQLAYIVPASVSAGNVFNITINGKTVSYTTSVGTVADVCSGLASAIANSTIPEFGGSELVATNNTTYLLLTAGTPGQPFTATTSASVGAGTTTPTLTLSTTISVPTGVGCTDNPGAGTLNANTAYYYRVSAINAAGETTAAAEQSVTTSNNGLNTHAVTITWTAVPGATGYRVYGRSTGAELFIAGVNGASAVSYQDTGSITPSGALPASNTTATPSSGPNDWSTAANWSTGTVPAGSDDVYIENSTVNIYFGLNQSSVTLNSLNIAASFTGSLGLPQYNANGYYEYRQDYLKIGIGTGGAQVGYGPGTGSGRIKIDANAILNITFNVYGTGSALDQGVPTLLIKNTGNNAVLDINAGSVGVCNFAGDTGTIGTLRIGFISNVDGDATVRVGAGCTLGGVTKSGGALELWTGCTSLTQYGGTTDVMGSASVLQLTLDGEIVHYRSSGTLGGNTTVAGGATLDFSKDLQARSVTNPVVLYKGATLLDPNKTVSALVYQTKGCTEADCTINVGYDRTHTLS